MGVLDDYYTPNRGGPPDTKPSDVGAEPDETVADRFASAVAGGALLSKGLSPSEEQVEDSRQLGGDVGRAVERAGPPEAYQASVGGDASGGGVPFLNVPWLSIGGFVAVLVGIYAFLSAVGSGITR